MNRDSIVYFFENFNNPPADIGKIVWDNKDLFLYKGYGTPEMEMKYLHDIFLYIQSTHPEFKSFAWSQGNAYNDNYYYFNLDSFLVNNTHYVNTEIDFNWGAIEGEKILSEIYFDSISNPDPEEIQFAKNRKLDMDADGLNMRHWDAFYNYKKKIYKHLEIPCLKMLVFLKELEVCFSIYYFIYTFGNGVEVKFTKEGVTVTKPDAHSLGYEPLGAGMDIDGL